MKIKKHDRREKMDQIINHAVLSLDFWQDTVTYEGCTMPTGTIGCEVLNIPDSTIEKLDTPCNVLNQLLQGMNTGSVDMKLLPQVQQAAGAVSYTHLRQTPFVREFFHAAFPGCSAPISPCSGCPSVRFASTPSG